MSVMTRSRELYTAAQEHVQKALEALNEIVINTNRRHELEAQYYQDIQEAHKLLLEVRELIT